MGDAERSMELIDHLAVLLGFDPFTYLVVTIVGISVWVWCSVVGSVALTGRSLWLRRASLVLAGLGAVLFAYTARTLH